MKKILDWLDKCKKKISSCFLKISLLQNISNCTHFLKLNYYSYMDQQLAYYVELNFVLSIKEMMS
jgi:hypothetical protein